MGYDESGRRRYYAAHRVAWEAVHGPLPEGFVPDHKCRVRHCTNVDHLRLVSHGENTILGRGARMTLDPHDYCVNEHAFTPENTYWHPTKRSRVCRRCVADAQARRKVRLAA